MELTYLLLETIKIFKKKCTGKIIQLTQKILNIKVKNCKVKIGNGLPKMINFFYTTSVPKLISPQSVTFDKIIKMKFLKKLLPIIMLTPREKFIRKKQNIRLFGDGLKPKDLLE
jgi:alcohol dehydrogenase YqhD (iron-dependent ADH family)